VDDPDATYARTLQAGATSFYAPTDDHPSGDRWGAVKDSFGNHWYIASSWMDAGTGGAALRTAVPAPSRSAQMIPFMETVFGRKRWAFKVRRTARVARYNADRKRHAGD